MSTDRTSFHVAFDEKWQRDFESLADAEEWAKEISTTTGQMTRLVERWESNPSVGCRLRAAFPKERSERSGETPASVKSVSAAAAIASITGTVSHLLDWEFQ